VARKDKLNLSRRDFIKSGAFALAGLALPGRRDILNVTARSFTARNPAVRELLAVPAAVGLSDPALQPKFVKVVPDALDPNFKFTSPNGKFKVAVGPSVQMTGLVGTDGITALPTPVWGYGKNGKGFTWPGPTFEVQSGVPIEVKWENKLLDPVNGAFLPHLLPVDTSLHWAYSLPGYSQYTIANAGVPIVAHLHGGHTDFQFDGNPEFFFSPGWGVRGPQWVEKKYIYDNSQGAGNLWYHDHALGITRLNVYAGLAGFYFVRDEFDTGKADNQIGLPAWPYEKAYAIQDRMFRETGELFYPAFPGDPFYEGFIDEEGAALPDPIFPGGGPTALAEFFGDHMVVNGVIWPKEDVEPRNYRLHLLNGTDSRFMVIRFRKAASPTATDLNGADDPIPFYVIGSDQGLASAAMPTDTLVSEPGSRYDLVIDFSQVPAGSRVIMENIGWDAPFGGGFGENPEIDDVFLNRQTDRIMAFDVVLQKSDVPDTFDSGAIANYGYKGNGNTVDNVRKVALFEGKDEFGRLQPLLGALVNEGQENEEWKALPWHSPTTENPAVNTTEEWEIYNFTMDAHPVHLHLVNFQILGRKWITFDSDESDQGVQQVPQHNGTFGTAPTITNVVKGDSVTLGSEYVENAPKDMVTALPGQVTRIKATFDKPGRYVWHCHILSHEDHEMMRVLHVGPGA
jgi:FtsP/CotA-like multicopper oxidase with cupredoxin domain